MDRTKDNIATFIAILFHFCGCIGILFTPYKDWFIANTPFNLCLMAALLFWTQPGKRKELAIFFVACFFAGMTVEMIGVNTGWLFGTYSYGHVLGKKMNGVPLLLGVNWFIIIFCSASLMLQFQQWLLSKLATEDRIPTALTVSSFVIDAAMLATLFDWVMEPVAIKLGFWQWAGNSVPFSNYICWFLVSVLLLVLFHRLSFARLNHFAVHLFIIQLLFFLALRTQSFL